MFFTPGRFTRRGALPRSVQTLLQDQGSVQVLDGPAHHQRKQLFVDLLGPGRFDGLTAQMREQWARALPGWAGAGRIVLLTEVRRVLCGGYMPGAGCRWRSGPSPPAPRSWPR